LFLKVGGRIQGRGSPVADNLCCGRGAYRVPQCPHAPLPSSSRAQLLFYESAGRGAACRQQRSTPGSAGSRSPGHGCRRTPPGRAGNRWLSAPVCCEEARRHARGSKNGRSQRAPGNDRSGPCARAAGVCCTHAVRMRSTRRKHAGGNGVRWQSRPASERDMCSFSKTAVAIRSTWCRAESSPSVRLCERGG
jgi:hypothetical protein